MTDLTPVGRLLEDARKRLGLSQNEVARRAEASGTTYRNVIRGYSEHGGNRVPFNGAADTVANFARAVGVDSAALREAGRVEAANILLDTEIRSKHGHKTEAQLKAESDAIADQIRDIMRRRGMERDSEEAQQLDGWVVTLAEKIAEYDP